MFTQIINGKIPGQFIWQDEVCVSFVDVRPLSPGHSLVVPRLEVDQWIDLPADVAAHLMQVAHLIGNALPKVVQCERVGLLIAGFEVPHAHVHVIPINSMADFDFANADIGAAPEALAAMAEQLLAELSALGDTALDNLAPSNTARIDAV